MVTTSYPPIPVYVGDIYIITTDADFLDTLAFKYYSDASYWWIIAQANGVKGSLKPKTGTQLRIPMNVQQIVANFNSENS